MEEKIEKKPGFFERLHASKKKQVLFCVVSVIILSTVCLFGVNIIKENRILEKIDNLEAVTDIAVLYDFIDCESNEREINVSGWVLRLDSKNQNVRIFLQSTDKNEKKMFNTDMQRKDEIGEVFTPMYDFGEIGFNAEISKEQLEKDVCYEVFLVLDYKECIEKQSEEDWTIKTQKITTGVYLFNEKIYTYDPLFFSDPKVTDSELIEVICNGTVRAYDLDKRIWIYQLNDELYFITNPAFGSLKENEYKIPVMPRTSRVELLPGHRVQDGFDHLGAYYEDAIYAREGVLPYQIVKVTLSDKYPNTYITTGIYDVQNETWIRLFIFSVADWSVNKLEKEKKQNEGMY